MRFSVATSDRAYRFRLSGFASPNVGMVQPRAGGKTGVTDRNWLGPGPAPAAHRRGGAPLVSQGSPCLNRARVKFDCHGPGLHAAAAAARAHWPGRQYGPPADRGYTVDHQVVLPRLPMP